MPHTDLSPASEMVPVVEPAPRATPAANDKHNPGALARLEMGSPETSPISYRRGEPGIYGHAAELVGVGDCEPNHGRVLTSLYDTLRRCRIEGFTEVFAPANGNAAMHQMMDLRPVEDGTNRVAQRLDIAISRTAAAIARHHGVQLDSRYLAGEVEAHLRSFFDRIYASRWFRAVYDRNITRGQYVYTLSNMHQFVRFTTRILGRCVAHANDTNLRLHFIKHLSEEVNHEQIIERDLAAMGEDIEYVKNHMPPNLATRQFMAAQESAIGFHRDPILLMAAPLAAEGISGHLDQEFLDALHECAASWGVIEPRRITRFYASHMEFDGGDDGHWEGTIAMLAAHLTDESRLARFLSVLANTTDAMQRCYDSWIDDVRLT